MPFLANTDLAQASVEQVQEDEESMNCFFRLKDGQTIFVDTNWETINAPMFRDFTRPEFHGTERWVAVPPDQAARQPDVGVCSFLQRPNAGARTDVNTR